MIKVETISLFFLLCIIIQAYGANVPVISKDQDVPKYIAIKFPGVESPPNAPQTCGLFGKDDAGVPLNYGVDESKFLPNQILAVPYQAMIGADHAGKLIWICAGHLINDRWVLAAAHCDDGERAITTLRFGEKDIEYPSEFPNMHPVDIGILEIIPHPDYKKNGLFSNDLALIKMETAIPPNRFDIRPICLPWGAEAERTFIGTEVYQVGRFIDNNAISSVNIKDEVRVLTTAACENITSSINEKDSSGNVKKYTADDFVCTESVIPGDHFCEHMSGSAVGYYDDLGRVTAISLVTAGLLNKCPVISIPLYAQQNLVWIKAVAF